jgi:hypothetical protein
MTERDPCKPHKEDAFIPDIHPLPPPRLVRGLSPPLQPHRRDDQLLPAPEPPVDVQGAHAPVIPIDPRLLLQTNTPSPIRQRPPPAAAAPPHLAISGPSGRSLTQPITPSPIQQRPMAPPRLAGPSGRSLTQPIAPSPIQQRPMAPPRLAGPSGRSLAQPIGPLWRQQKEQADNRQLEVMTLKRHNEEMREMHKRTVHFVIYHTVRLGTADEGYSEGSFHVDRTAKLRSTSSNIFRHIQMSNWDRFLNWSKILS